MSDPLSRTSADRSQLIKDKVGQTELLKALGVQPDVDFLVNITEDLTEVTQYALGCGWAPSESWAKWRKQISELHELLKLDERRFRPKSPTHHRGNPLGGEFDKEPAASLLAQDPILALSGLAPVLKAATVYHLARNTGIAKKSRIKELRIALGGGGHSDVLELLLQENTEPTALQLEAAAYRILSTVKDRKRPFLAWLAKLLRIEVSPRIRMSPVQTDKDEQDNEGDILLCTSVEGDSSIEDSEDKREWLLEMSVSSLFEKGADAREIESEVEAEGRQSHYWVASIESCSAYAWNALNPIERQFLVKTIQQSIYSDHASSTERIAVTVILLSLVTGRTFDQILRMNYGKGGDITPDREYWRVSHSPQNAFIPPDGLVPYLHPVSDRVPVILPQLAIDAIKCHETDLTDEKASMCSLLKVDYHTAITACKNLLSTLKDSTGYRISASRVRHSLRQQLARQGVDKHSIHVLTSGPNEAPPIESYYVSISCGQLNRYYERAVEAILLV